MHLLSGAANHSFDKMRKRIRLFESDSDFLAAVRNALKEVETNLDQLATTSAQRKNNSVGSVGIPLHKESLKIRQKNTCGH